ncbi:MAG: dienelactone hydrolase family protein [Xanthobacteraceae bacterium]
MSGSRVQIPSSSGGTFDCYLAMPASANKTPAIVLACAIVGVDEDLRAIADAFATSGYIAAAPDLFWRTVPGPLVHEDPRTRPRGQPRPEKIKTGEADMADTLNYIRALPQHNGRAAAMGFCYGGPYAILGPARLGYEAGVSCHGSQMLDFIHDLDGVTAPICVMWGDKDFAAPPEVRDAYRTLAARRTNVEVHVFPGIDHGYMLPHSPAAFNAKTRGFSMSKALALLAGLGGDHEPKVVEAAE